MKLTKEQKQEMKRLNEIKKKRLARNETIKKNGKAI